MSDLFQWRDFWNDKKGLCRKNRRRTTHIFCLLTKSFKKSHSFMSKPFVGFIDLPNYDQSERIKERYFFIKNSTTKIIPHKFNFNKIFCFVLFFLLFCLHCRIIREMCAYKDIIWLLNY